jgi:flavodoxin
MSRKLVAYFSASGTTAELAKTLAGAVGADLHEIKPAKPYSKADLDWTNAKSRSSVEMNDRKFRPEIANRVADMEQYDTVYIGFPIWWYTAPTIINTFLEGYDLTGRTVIPFATSGSSGMGNTSQELAASCPRADLREGRRFASRTSAEQLTAWAKSFH